MPRLTWAYGVTTVPERSDTTLPPTLASLALAGFDKPRLFVDGERDTGRADHYATFRYPRVGAYGNWWLSIVELFIRDPNCHRYALFQDDLLCSKNLRQYLEECTYPEKGYLNLYTWPCNQSLAKGRQGWYESDQKGRGALALVFNRETLMTLLCRPEFVTWPTSPKRNDRKIDGRVVTALTNAGYKEYVHNPTLVMHREGRSAIGLLPHPPATSFRGEEFDCLELSSRR